MNRWKALGQVLLLAASVALLFVLSWWAKREVVRQVREELQDQLAEDVKRLKETAFQHRMQLEAQIEQIKTQAAVEVSRDSVEVANDLWRILAVEHSAVEGACGTSTGTGTSIR